MAARTVTAPDGTRWKVGRLWLPERSLRWRRWRRRKNRRGDSGDVLVDGVIHSPGGGGGGGGFFSSVGDDIAVAFALILAVGVFILLFLLIATVIFPLIVLGLELMLLLVLLLGGLTGRLLFRRPWTVRARAADGRIMRWHVRGFRRSGSVRNEIATALAAGQGEPVLAGATRLPDASTTAIGALTQPAGPPPTMRA